MKAVNKETCLLQQVIGAQYGSGANLAQAASNESVSLCTY